MFDGSFHTYGAMITQDWITVFYDGKELSRFPIGPNNIDSVCRTLQAAGIIFIHANGYGPGVRLRR